ncbi:MAG: ATP-dependent helicase, partial [Nevskia sp.]|nr:ATP-dependent helicase [Nevskia sp.]
TEMQEFRDMPDLTEAVDALAIAASELERPFLELGGRIAWRQFSTLPGATSALGAARNALGECSDELKRYAERSAGLDAVSQRARALVKRMDLITAADESPEAAATSVRWVESVGRGGALHTAPVEPTEGFRSFMAAYPGAWVFTSATLAAGKDFTHFTDTLGLTEARTLRLDSPFDYARQARLYLPRDLPDPNTPEHPEAVADMLLPLIEASGGGAFVLCTSHRALARIAAKLRKSAFPLFVQGEDAKSVLVDRFSRAGNGILVATSSFWEGVDVKGMALRLVAIDKLPFGQQNDPVFEARLEAVRARGGNPFSEVQLPRAITTLRQGVGRLIRDDADHGLIVICDPRIRGKSYGKRVLASLPAMPLLADAAEAAAWLRGLKAA